MLPILIVFLTTAPEINRTQFDLPETESIELVAGIFPEHSGRLWGVWREIKF